MTFTTKRCEAPNFVASTPDYTRPATAQSGEVWVFLASSASGLTRPWLVVADVGDTPTDVAAVAAELDHASYSFLSALRSKGCDLIIVGNKGASAGLDINAAAVHGLATNAMLEHTKPLVVIAIGRGATASRYGLCFFNILNNSSYTSTYVSYNGAAPSAEEQQLLEERGWWPRDVRRLKVTTRGFADPLANAEFDDVKLEADPAPTGAAISPQLGAWIIERAL